MLTSITDVNETKRSNGNKIYKLTFINGGVVLHKVMRRRWLIDEDPAAFLSLSSFMVLEPIKNILTLNLTIKA